MVISTAMEVTTKNLVLTNMVLINMIIINMIINMITRNMITRNMITRNMITRNTMTINMNLLMIPIIIIVKNVNMIHMVKLFNKHQQFLYPNNHVSYHNNNNIKLVTIQLKFHHMAQYNNHA
jgi:hypothetical protein